MAVGSRGEIKIAEILEMNHVPFTREFIFPKLTSSSGRPLRFDFCVFDDDGEIDFLIEYQGEQHYTNVKHFGGGRHLQIQKYNDNQKRMYCLQHHYPLVEVPYWDYEKLNYDYLMTAAEEKR